MSCDERMRKIMCEEMCCTRYMDDVEVKISRMVSTVAYVLLADAMC
jgi:hypothetical protein